MAYEINPDANPLHNKEGNAFTDALIEHMQQLTINFPTGHSCHHCQKDPGLKPGNPAQWFGFYDADVKQYVCFQCQKKHYQQKQQKTFSELPVILSLNYK